MRKAMDRITAGWRRAIAVAGEALSTAPGKWSVLSVILAARVVPRKTQRVHMALGCMRQGEAIRGRMTGIFKMERLRGPRIDPHCARCRHVNEVGCLY